MVCKQLRQCIEDKNKECKREKGCIQFTDKRTCVKCEEKRKVYRLHNDCGVKIRKYQMDGGIVKNENGFDACDNLLIVHDTEKKKAIFIELKATDLKQAVKQTYETACHFQGCLQGYAQYARIVHTRGVPDIRNSSRMVDLLRLLKKSGGNFKMQEWSLDDTLSGLNEMQHT